jgi:hypothetical protein
MVGEVALPLAAVIEKSSPEALRGTVWGEAAASSVNWILPLALPTEAAVKVRFREHMELMAKVAPHVFVCEKIPDDPGLLTVVMF